jgi:2-methylcitrate dehydratase PrpD
MASGAQRSGSAAQLRGSAGEELGRFAAGLTLADIPDDVVERLRCNLLHDLACALAAHSEGAGVWDLVRDYGPPEATVLCDGARVDAEHAAFANATLMHTRAQDDTHFAAKTHVGSAVIPAALALAERDGATGADFLVALAAGCEVACAVGERLAAAATDRGFRATPIFGPLGAAAAGARLRGLDASATADAIAIASSFAAGLNQMWIDGSSEYRFELGMAARNGVVASALAAGGFKGATRWYEGDAGFARAFAGGDDPPGDWELGTRWRALDVTYKPYPVCAITQSPVDLAIGLTREHDVDPDDVVAVRCHLNPADRTYPGTVNDGPFGDIAASLMSAQFCVAMAIKDRAATLAGLRELDDPALMRLVHATDVLGDEALPPLAARVEIDLAGGDTLAGELVPTAETYGWDWDGVLANVARMEPEMRVGRAALDELADAVRRVSELESVEPLVRPTVG